MQDTIRGVDIWFYQLRIIDDDFLRSRNDLEVVPFDCCDYARGEYRIIVGEAEETYDLHQGQMTRTKRHPLVRPRAS